jgi:hypothetical protein
MSATENWYVYYPAPPAAAAALPRLRAMQIGLTQRAAIRARVEERVGTDAAPTWMEVYEGVTDPEVFAAALQAAVGTIGLAPEQVAARHTERFRTL